ncbi:Transcription factor E2FA [Porphyridium purpureum]|uniref:Transcription factor E2FA n=1 Tax=Porphyridium purpureum TaxID=35688 RepID=A0A5J4YJG7_PORPP|nr:Transcription factor E2FA [Porphyridium purpureum]|eukprot:POR4467..scf291_13
MRGRTPSKRKLDDSLDGAAADAGGIRCSALGGQEHSPRAAHHRAASRTSDDGGGSQSDVALPADESKEEMHPELNEEYSADGQTASQAGLKKMRTARSNTSLPDDARLPIAAGEASEHCDVPSSPQATPSSVPVAASAPAAAAATAARPAKPAKMGKTGAQYGASGSMGAPNASTGGGGRLDNSLGHLTEKFLRLVEESRDRELDLNETAIRLQVQKRRIYDIVNVLEGIGVVSKHAKNKVVWNEQFDMDRGASKRGSRSGSGLALGSCPDSDEEDTREVASAHDAEIEKLTKEVAELGDEERAMQESIAQLQNELSDLSSGSLSGSGVAAGGSESASASARMAYVTHEDIFSIPEFQDRAVWAIKAPLGSELMIPDPAVQGKTATGKHQYQIFLRSSGGPIEWSPIRNPAVSAAESGAHTHRATSSIASPTQHQHLMAMMAMMPSERNMPSPDRTVAGLLSHGGDCAEEDSLLELPYDYVNLGLGAEMYGDEYTMGHDERASTLADLFC